MIQMKRWYMNLLYEGRVQHLPRFELNARKALHKAIVTYYINQFYVEIGDRAPIACKVFEQMMFTKFSLVDPVSVKRSTNRNKSIFTYRLPRPTLDELPQNWKRLYQDAVECWEEYGDPVIKIFFDNKFPNPGASGQLIGQHNRIEIDGSIAFQTFVFNSFSNAVRAKDANKCQNIIDRIMEKTIAVEATLRHELIHFYQTSFFDTISKGMQFSHDPFQNTARYFTSHVEHPAFVSQTIDKVRQLTRILRNHAKKYVPTEIDVFNNCFLYNKPFAEFTNEIGYTPPSQYQAYPLISGSVKFFNELKIHKPTAYRKAITLVARELQ